MSPVPAAPAVPTAETVAVSALAPESIVTVLPAVMPPVPATLTVVSPTIEAAAVVVDVRAPSASVRNCQLGSVSIAEPMKTAPPPRVK